MGPYELFTSDASLAKLNAFAAASTLSGPTRSHFDTSGVRAEDLQLTTRWGFRSGEVSRAVRVALGEPVDPPAGAVERLKTSLVVLSMCPDRTVHAHLFDTPEMRQSAQAQLTELLLTYPVLMHPALHVYVYDGSSRSASVPHAIALARHARFPMEGDPGVDRGALLQFIDNASVPLGFVTRSIQTDQTSVLVRGMLPLESAARNRQPMHRLWASVDQLYDLVRTQAHEPNKFAGDLVPPEPRASWDGEGVESYAWAFYCACGFLDGAPFPAFHAAVAKNRYGGNLHLQGEVSKLMPAMVMGGMVQETHGTVASRFDAVVAGLVAAKMADNPAEGAYLVCEAFGKHGVRKCNAEEVVEMLRAAHRLGAELLDGQVFGLLAETADWRQALTVFGTERDMLEHISKAVVADSGAGARAVRRRAGL